MELMAILRKIIQKSVAEKSNCNSKKVRKNKQSLALKVRSWPIKFTERSQVKKLEKLYENLIKACENQ